MDLETHDAVSYPAEGAADALLVLAHGAGAGQRHPFMTAVARGLAHRGFDVVTFDFPYMRQQRRVPDRPPVLERAFLDTIETARRASRAGALFIGGKSMGGRMATHLAAAGVTPLRGIVVFGYPLHPPGKPEQLRVHHLPSITVPILVVQGERDAFGTPAELEPVLKSLPTRAEMHVVRGGDHSLAVRGLGREKVLGGVLDVVATWIRRW